MSANATRLELLVEEIAACRACADDLPQGPRPVLTADARAKILIAGQAPGLAVHQSGVPWRDPSGERLRDWLGLDDAAFYDPQLVAIIPTGFCYPGRGRSGDLPPRPECRALWHPRLLPLLPAIELRLLVGEHAQRHHLGAEFRGSVTATVQAWESFGASVPTPHPSPRNRRWLQRNPFFEREVVPALRRRVRALTSR